MDLDRSLLDLVLVPMSILLCVGYHIYLWLSLRSNPDGAVAKSKLSSTGRNAWMRKVSKEKEKGGPMLGVQSMRNALMTAILSATISISITATAAALSSNAFNAGNVLRHLFFGIQSGPALPLKYASITLVSLSSFACSSMAVSCLVDACFLLSSREAFDGSAKPVMERGCLLATVGNRLLYMAIVVVMWLLGPVPLALASVAMVGMLHSLDFIDERRMRFAMLLSGG